MAKPQFLFDLNKDKEVSGFNILGAETTYYSNGKLIKIVKYKTPVQCTKTTIIEYENCLTK